MPEEQGEGGLPEWRELQVVRRNGQTLGFVLSKGLIRGFTRCQPVVEGPSVLPIFGCIQRTPHSAAVGTLRRSIRPLEMGAVWGISASALGTGELPAPAFPNN